MSEPRNLLKDWCPTGLSLDQVRGVRGTEWLMGLETRISAWKRVRVEERRAAWYLAVHSGRTPEPCDGEVAGNGLVDFLLGGIGATVEVAEVMATSDEKFMRNAHHLHRNVLVGIANAYEGNGAWGFEFERGVILPRGKELTSSAAEWAGVLVDSHAAPGELVELSGFVRAYRLAEEHPEGVYFASMNAEVPESGGGPYLDRLSAYLQIDENIVKHVEKLARESESLNASRRHLYLLMAAAGKHGALLPASPSYFTWGKFDPPNALTDLWLDGNNSALFHWSIESGWIYHPEHT